MPDIPPFVGFIGGVGGIAAGAAATVTFGQVTAGNDQAGRVKARPGGVFTNYGIKNSYEKDTHTYMAGVSSPNGFNGQKAAFFQLYTDTLVLVCRWTAVRWGKQPIIPSEKPSNQNLQYLYGHVETMNVTTGPNWNTALYSINGTYVYGFKTFDPALLNNVSFALDPRFQDTFTNGRNMPVSLEDITLMEAQNVGAGGGNNARLRG